MKSKGFFAVLLGLGLIFTPGVDAFGAPGNGKGRGNGGKKSVTVSKDVTMSPTAIRSPITTESTVQVCVSGFSEGNYVSVAVPWWGSSDLHTVLSYGRFVDATGGFCVKPPPDWTEMNLEPGTYPIKTIWYPSSTSPEHRKGPDTTFEVMGN